MFSVPVTGARAAQATCSAPYCLDMRNYPMFRNGACMCAAQTLAHVRDLAVAARDQSAFAAVGARGSAVTPLAALNPPLPARLLSLFESQDMLNGPIDEVPCVRVHCNSRASCVDLWAWQHCRGCRAKN